MQYDRFKGAFNKIVFGKSKSDLLEKIAKHPDRYIGIFRPTKAKAKIIQNLTQSNEIRFGDAFEKIIRDYFEENKYKNLDRDLLLDGERRLVLDQLIAQDDKIIFIEQKVRDDHDSTKKRGQMENFVKKIYILTSKYKGKRLQCFFFFVDPSLQKNKKYYETEMKKISKQSGIEADLVYGEELFAYLGLSESWNEIIQHLKGWRNELPDLPEINFDIDAQDTFQEIKDLSPSVFIKLFANGGLYDILKVIFPSGEVLKLLAENFEERSKTKQLYKKVLDSIDSHPCKIP